MDEQVVRQHALGERTRRDDAILRVHALGDVAAVFLDQRVGLVIREGAVHLEAQPCRPARQTVEPHPLSRR